MMVVIIVNMIVMKNVKYVNKIYVYNVIMDLI